MNISNADLRHCPDALLEGDDGSSSDYVGVANEFADESVDFVLIDGIHRGAVAMHVTPKVRRGGLVVIDNVNWYLPSNSRSPASRTLDDGPAEANWETFSRMTKDWRRIWTSSDVWDTLILFKP